MILTCNILHFDDFDDIDNMSASQLANISMRKIVNNAFREPADLFGASPLLMLITVMKH